MPGQWRRSAQRVRVQRDAQGPWQQSKAMRPVAWEPFDFKTGGGASYDFTWAAGTYSRIRIQVDALLPATDGVDLFMRFYIAGALEDDAADYEWNTNSVDPTPGNTPRGDGSDSEISLFGTTGIGNAAGEGFSGTVEIGSMAVRPRSWGTGNVVITTGASRSVHHGGSYIGGAGALTGVQFLFSSGDIASGTIVIEGLVSQ